ncbi:MAG: hypothetical protein ACRCSY_07780 [Cetobacterium sp.]|nr:hypothetical protein CB452P1_000048 [Clostridium phage CB452P1]
MKLKCIKSNNKMFLENEMYKVKGIGDYNGTRFYTIRDEELFCRFVKLKGALWEFEIVKEDKQMNENTWNLDVTPEGEYVLYLQTPYGIKDMYITEEEAKLIESQTSCEIGKLPF